MDDEALAALAERLIALTGVQARRAGASASQVAFRPSHSKSTINGSLNSDDTQVANTEDDTLLAVLRQAGIATGTAAAEFFENAVAVGARTGGDAANSSSVFNSGSQFTQAGIGDPVNTTNGGAVDAAVLLQALLSVASATFERYLRADEKNSSAGDGDDDDESDIDFADELRRAVVLRALELADENKLGGRSLAARVISVLIFELRDFEDELLLDMLDRIQERMQPRKISASVLSGHMCSFELIPAALAQVRAIGDTHSAAAASSAILQVCERLRDADRRVPRAKVIAGLREVAFSSENLLHQAIAHVGACVGTTAIADLPEVFSQFLLFATANGLPGSPKTLKVVLARHVVRALLDVEIHHFGNSGSEDGLPSRSDLEVVDKAFTRLERAVQQDVELGEQIIKYVKSTRNYTALTVGAVLFLGAHARLHKTATDALVSALDLNFDRAGSTKMGVADVVVDGLSLVADVSWHNRIAADLKIENQVPETLALLSHVVTIGWEGLLEPLWQFALLLVSRPARRSPYASDDLSQTSGAYRSVADVGRGIIQVIYASQPSVRAAILGRLVTKFTDEHSSQVSRAQDQRKHSQILFSVLIGEHAQLLADNYEGWFENVIFSVFSSGVSPSAIQSLIDALMPVITCSKNLRNSAILALRKTLASRPMPMRVAAIHSLLSLLRQTVAMANQPENAFASLSPISVRTTGKTAATVSSKRTTADPEFSESEKMSVAINFGLEVVNMLRPAQTQSVELRSLCYASLVEVARLIPVLREQVFAILDESWSMILRPSATSAQSAPSPLSFESCVKPVAAHSQTWENAASVSSVSDLVLSDYIAEPAGDLLSAMVQCLSLNQDDDLDGAKRFRNRLWEALSRLVISAATLLPDASEIEMDEDGGADPDLVELEYLNLDYQNTNFAPSEADGIRSLVRARMCVNALDVLIDFCSLKLHIRADAAQLTNLGPSSCAELASVVPQDLFRVRASILRSVARFCEDQKSDTDGKKATTPAAKGLLVRRLRIWLESGHMIGRAGALSLFRSYVSDETILQHGSTGFVTHVMVAMNDHAVFSLEAYQSDNGKRNNSVLDTTWLRSAAEVAWRAWFVVEQESEGSTNLSKPEKSVLGTLARLTVSLLNSCCALPEADAISTVLDTFRSAKFDFESKHGIQAHRRATPAFVLMWLVRQIGVFTARQLPTEAELCVDLVMRLCSRLGAAEPEILKEVAEEVAASMGAGPRRTTAFDDVTLSQLSDASSKMSPESISCIEKHPSMARQLLHLYLGTVMACPGYMPVCHSHEDVDIRSTADSVDIGSKPNETNIQSEQPQYLTARNLRTLLGSLNSDKARYGAPAWKIVTPKTAGAILTELLASCSLAIREAEAVLARLRESEDQRRVRSTHAAPTTVPSNSTQTSVDHVDDESVADRLAARSADIRCEVYDHLRAQAEVLVHLLGTEIPVKYASTLLETVKTLFVVLCATVRDLHERKETRPPTSFQELVSCTNDSQRTAHFAEQLNGNFYVSKVNEAIKLHRSKARAQHEQESTARKQKAKTKQAWAAADAVKSVASNTLVAQIQKSMRFVTQAQDKFEELLLTYEKAFIPGSRLTRRFIKIQQSDFAFRNLEADDTNISQQSGDEQGAVHDQQRITRDIDRRKRAPKTSSKRIHPSVAKVKDEPTSDASDGEREDLPIIAHRSSGATSAPAQKRSRH